MSSLVAVLVDGVAYGMLLFLSAVGLSVTLGLMRFINLAHGAFAMVGAYLAVVVVGAGLPFLLALPLVFVVVGAFGIVIERTAIRHLYQRNALEQVLFSIGLAFALGALANLIFGPQQQAIQTPGWLTGRVALLGLEITSYRLFLIAMGAATAIALIYLFEHTLFGARIRAAVDNRRAAEGIGIQVERLFALTFGLGAALAGLGGALSVEMLGLDPAFALKYLTMLLMVVAIGGAGSIEGSLLAALGLGTVDALFKYLLPEAGGFVIFGLLVAVLLVKPAGLKGRAA
ncbi:Branched-chain amino acid transport system permease protein [Bosea sp. 62]|uniref:branched-chain amino acid ABC transporter permease n=1 Tax=unclassified Bosea (in: a-proteobacteria) TaxID=2653178 RepID=UPI001253C874|nr:MULTISPECIES: branched-chain amino acid ABC transporter permease [unclassified Bosea (in: a-proteobacteria)]CAD5260815.1 Branched-chain amino acid transport system permease protein [Bosea sp. 46]CAD5265360.1 Branched-chain amino acid transport system permease protein [Bosea sp. 21B]CAD5274996.1 Branched-chain amino acid transport system permease protein [Bosea sp. 7B]VVT59201.1 Branched-chain amino acid transport system permease protein [Bosea sp. EC-HK365B]VXB73309.1 Branched-chain amino a